MMIGQQRAPGYMYTLFAMFGLLWLHTDGTCTFPANWRGSWYQSGLGEVQIKEDAIKEKGTCVDQNNDYYLLENSEDNCVRCLLMMQRHKNIIQYKEGYCVQKKPLRDVCGEIRAEYILYTLIREGSQPVRCPFQSAYHFAYNNNTSGFCRRPASYVRPCASDSKFTFKFRRCSDVLDTYERELEFQCLATWKDGSDTYIYGGFAGPGIYKRDDMYRCFMYQSLGADIHLAMSADASCRGLRAPTDGPLVIEFKQDATDWPQEGCTFPDWLRGVTWQDLSGRHFYSLDAKAEVLRIKFKRKQVVHTRTAFRCLEAIGDTNTADEFVALTLTSRDCETSRQCIRVLRRYHQVLEIHQGHIKQNSIKECLETDKINRTSHHLVIPETLEMQACPLPGRYVLEHTQSDCTGHIHIGCNGTSVIGVDVDKSCAGLLGPIHDRRLECLKTWEEKGRRYVIARRLGADESLFNCFAIENQENTYHLYTDRDCNLGAPYFSNKISRYTFSGPTGGCREGSYEIEEGVQEASGGSGRGVLSDGRERGGASRPNAAHTTTRTIFTSFTALLVTLIPHSTTR